MASTPPVRPGSGAIADARSCKDWLASLPVTSIPQAQQQVLDGLRGLNRAELGPLERLKCLELVREKIAFLNGEQRSRFIGKTLPLSAIDQSAWTTGRTLLEELEAGYRQCLAAAQGGDGAVAGHAALMSQRVIRCLAAQMLHHAIVYRRVDGELWLRLHREFQAAEQAGRVAERVKDSLEGDEGVSSIGESYLVPVLLQAADLGAMTVPQIAFAEALLRRWAKKAHVLPGTPTGSCPLAVDLSAPAGAAPLAGAALATHRALDLEQLSRSIRRRIKALQAGESVASLGQPEEAAGIDVLAQLQGLHRCWCEGAPEPPQRIPPEREAAVVFGLPDIHFYLSGAVPFEQPDRPRELSRQEKDDIAVFGRVSERTNKMRIADFNITAETWGVLGEALGAWRLLRPANASRGVAIGRVAALRVGDSAQFFLGEVKALAQQPDGSIEITVSLFPGRPEPVAVRAADLRSRQGASWVQGIRLPPLERLGIPESYVLATGVAARGRGIDLWDGGPKELAVREVLERGADFDRVALG